MREINETKLFYPFYPIKRKNDFIFTGRDLILERVLESISVPESTLIIFGERQVGKTSFMNQIINVIMNKSSFSENYSHITSNFTNQPTCISVDNTAFCKNLQGLLASIIISPSKYGLKRLFQDAYENDSTVQSIIKETTEITSNISLLKYRNLHKKNVSILDTKIDAPNTIHDYFHRLISHLSEKYNTELIFFIDEFDLLEDKNGVGKFIKSLQDTRFVFVGIGENASDLVKDHQSIRAKLYGNSFRIPVFNQNEFINIFERVEEQIRINQKLSLRFSKSYLQKAYNDSSGLPGYGHLIGLHTLSIVKKRHKKNPQKNLEVNEKDYQKAIERIFQIDLYNFEYALDQVNYSNVKDILEDQPNKREILLKLATLNSFGIDQSDLFSNINKSYRRGFQENLEILSRGKIPILKIQGETIKFNDPLLRVAINVVRHLYEN
ncbi:MAG TPA: hypothetical protein DCE41_22060 [Cytophagales bacterium]|nr:hypothetical protein [Cytophagales bacterium]HAA24401.1 hypothetical protein [Cytophagales bacterium]HAP59695.1 hypothetical protein [Cytophagales bacterium]